MCWYPGSDCPIQTEENIQSAKEPKSHNHTVEADKQSNDGMFYYIIITFKIKIIYGKFLKSQVFYI